MAETIDNETGEIQEIPQNLRHWGALSTTDPLHTKPFHRPGGFRGTAIRPIWNQYRLTEHFGPHGVGWGTEEPKFQVVEAGGELLVFCTLRCWYMDNENKRAEIYGVGGDKVLARFKEGPRSDDEAFKKAFTDALGNAFVRIGVSADVHMGLFEDSKYVAEARKQFDVATRVNPAAQEPSPDREDAIAAYRRIQAEIDEHGTPEPMWPGDDVATIQKFDGVGLIQLRQRLARKLQLKEMAP